MTHDYSTISVQLDERGVVSLRLDRAEKKNALSALMIEELTHFSSNLPKGTRVVVLSGAGDVFCAGGDLGWMKAQIDADRATRMHEARKLAMMLKALNELDAPLIGRVHGGAFGGGIGMCCVC
ncbi:MAG: enoyl-CoA hydratase-related protein, partial [Paracoccaceae bacterium]